MSSPAMHPYAIVDVFTDVPLEGNQVAVFSDGSGLGDELMQRAARELNLSETVFLLTPDDGADARIRIFTPVSELPFAGHPVLGTAFLLGDRLGIDLVRLQTGLGVVPIALTREGAQIVFGEMEQPIPPIEPFERTDELLSALGVASSVLPVQAYLNGPIHVYVGLESEAAVAALVPDMNALASIGVFGINCFAGSGTNYKLRMFAPGLGVTEDPATGSAAGPLAVHLARHGRIAFGDQIEIRQGVEIRRPSTLYARVEGSGDAIEQVLVGGSAVLVAVGEYRFS
jgi:trans-2,3-dihydro-3-hydroxyanthranilate isomerase